MSKTTKEKYVIQEVLDTYVLPEEEEQIVKVTRGCGNNLHEVQTVNGKTFLASMPTKFRKTVWIKRGDFVIIKPIEEGDKVKGEIIHILYKDQIKYIKSQGKWPSVFDDSDNAQQEQLDNDELFVNRNRPNVTYEDDSDSYNEDSESCEDDEDDDEN